MRFHNAYTVNIAAMINITNGIITNAPYPIASCEIYKASVIINPDTSIIFSGSLIKNRIIVSIRSKLNNVIIIGSG
jgi:hypothetical protein